MNGFDELVTWIYSEGDMMMFASRVIVFVFVLEAAAYMISLVSYFRSIR